MSDTNMDIGMDKIPAIDVRAGVTLDISGDIQGPRFRNGMEIIEGTTVTRYDNWTTLGEFPFGVLVGPGAVIERVVVRIASPRSLPSPSPDDVITFRVY